MDDEREARLLRAVKDAHATAMAAGLLVAAMMETIGAMAQDGTVLLSAACDRAAQLAAASADQSAEMATMTAAKIAMFRRQVRDRRN